MELQISYCICSGKLNGENVENKMKAMVFSADTTKNTATTENLNTWSDIDLSFNENLDDITLAFDIFDVYVVISKEKRVYFNIKLNLYSFLSLKISLVSKLLDQSQFFTDFHHFQKILLKRLLCLFLLFPILSFY